MKRVRISVGQEPLNGFVNVDPALGVDPMGMDELVNQAEADEIIVEHVLEHYPVDQIQQVLSYWVSKLRHKGKITVVFTSLANICRNYMYNRINEEEVNRLLYGGGDHAWAVRRGNYDLETVSNLLTNFGLEISSKEYDPEIGNYITVVAERP